MPPPPIVPELDIPNDRAPRLRARVPIVLHEEFPLSYYLSSQFAGLVIVVLLITVITSTIFGSMFWWPGLHGED